MQVFQGLCPMQSVRDPGWERHHHSLVASEKHGLVTCCFGGGKETRGGYMDVAQPQHATHVWLLPTCRWLDVVMLPIHTPRRLRCTVFCEHWFHWSWYWSTLIYHTFSSGSNPLELSEHSPLRAVLGRSSGCAMHSSRRHHSCGSLGDWCSLRMCSLYQPFPPYKDTGAPVCSGTRPISLVKSL